MHEFFWFSSLWSWGTWSYGFEGMCVGLIVVAFGIFLERRTLLQDPIIRQLGELDARSLEELLNEIPLWVKNPDYDRVDWLNKFLKDIWPCLEKAICKKLRKKAQPYIDKYGSKYMMNSIDFESLTLGTLPPTFVGMKVYDTKEREIIFEPSFKFAGNPNIIIAVKAFGLKATVQLVDVQAFATARITLKHLVPMFPCFSKVVISLMDKPHIDFGLKLLGGDVMAIPGLYGFVQDTIRDRVAEMYMWPKTLEIPIIDDHSAAKRPVGTVEVKIIRARNLLKTDFMGKADPYVKIRLVNSVLSKTTRTKANTLNPEWHEIFKLPVQDPKSQSLELEVFDWEKLGAHEKMGMQIVPLKDLVDDEPKSFTLPLVKNVDPNDEANSKKSRGDIVFEMTFKAFKEDDNEADIAEESHSASESVPHHGGVLSVTVHQAEEVEGKHHTNPFVELHFRGDKKKTLVIKKSTDPSWEQEFSWQLDDSPISDSLHVEVLSKRSSMNLFHRQESLGYVDIPLQDVVNNKTINEKFQLVDSPGMIQLELTWRIS
ncbi:synaptotagmin-2 isoform X1 [Physcomitrium patens]|uniref:synaptotagmin-2 isoform X1 n=1 Tax=Physcomitrium patens TaxID=3218 RepID=UPI000D165711|nr:synaptotagmin-2-like isoform X1 [Physcomitrium patens]|eukprot:XP_024362109.1 synaptotagmin-2-like isoform X1 [Physcomitrella patens]